MLYDDITMHLLGFFFAFRQVKNESSKVEARPSPYTQFSITPSKPTQFLLFYKYKPRSFPTASPAAAGSAAWNRLGSLLNSLVINITNQAVLRAVPH